MTTATTIDPERIRALAAILDVAELPPALQSEAEVFLNAHSDDIHRLVNDQAVPGSNQALNHRLTPEAVRWIVRQEVETALLLIACLETVPPVAVAGDDRQMLEHIGLGTNRAIRQAINDADGPLCLPFRVWHLLRMEEIARGEGPDPMKLGAPYGLPDRLLFCSGPIDTSFDLGTDDKWDVYYRQWRARRAAGEGA